MRPSRRTVAANVSICQHRCRETHLSAFQWRYWGQSRIVTLQRGVICSYAVWHRLLLLWNVLINHTTLMSSNNVVFKNIWLVEKTRKQIKMGDALHLHGQNDVFRITRRGRIITPVNGFAVWVTRTRIHIWHLNIIYVSEGGKENNR